MDVEVMLGTCERQAARRVRREVAEIPSLNKPAKVGDPRMLFQRAERGNTELMSYLPIR